MPAAMDPPQSRPRSKSHLSFKSQGSGKEHLRETHDEKAKSHFTPGTKANPNAAMNEAQPIAAALEKPTLQSLRAFNHTDSHGNLIAEPDFSNPTRSRWERPLDTIRSFEAAIDGEYRRRAQAMRPQSTVDMASGFSSRRSSYYGGYDNNRYSQVGGHHGNRGNHENFAENGHGMGGPVGGPGGPPRTRYNRMQSDPSWNHDNTNHNLYNNHGYRQSRDTVNTNGSTGSHSDPHTNPSSENSSIQHATPVMKHDLGEQYGFNGFGGGGPILEEYSNGRGPPQDGYPGPNNSTGAQASVRRDVPPPPPPHKTINLSNGPSPPTAGRPSPPEKRKSWFKRRFSKD